MDFIRGNALIFFISAIIVNNVVFAGDFNLVLLHTNDVHARFEQMDKYNGVCSEESAAEGKCYGGVARRATLVRQIRETNQNVLFLDAGDQFQGTIWFNYYSGTASRYFMNELKYDVMAPGNHDFDNGVQGLVPFLQNVSFPVVCCNIDISNEPSLKGLIEPSVVKTLPSGEKIGIVGYILIGMKEIVAPSGVASLSFEDEVTALQREVDKLTAQGINKIIALGHAGIEMDKRIATEVKGVDIVIGGHSHAFLYSGEPPSVENPVGEYPYVVTQSRDNKNVKVLMVTDFAYGKYLGVLNVTFDEAGDVTGWQGSNPVLLNSSIEQDGDMLNLLKEWKKPIANFTKKNVGVSRPFLDGDRGTCRVKECNMGNLIADALLMYYIKRTPMGPHWSNVSIAIINGGGIREAIPAGDISLEQVMTVLPFRNLYELVKLKGEHVVEALENAVSKYDPADPRGRFLQYSGLQVTFDLKKPEGQRVVKVMVKCTECNVPEFEPLDKGKVYSIITHNFLLDGGDGYVVLRDQNLERLKLDFLSKDALAEYTLQHSPVIPGLEGRILFQSESDDPPGPTCSASLPTTGLILSLVCLLIAMK